MRAVQYTVNARDPVSGDQNVLKSVFRTNNLIQDLRSFNAHFKCVQIVHTTSERYTVYRVLISGLPVVISRLNDNIIFSPLPLLCHSQELTHQRSVSVQLQVQPTLLQRC